MSPELKALLEKELPHLEPAFLDAINELGEHGARKHGENAFQVRRAQGRGREGFDRISTVAMMQHVKEHTDAYLAGAPHDHFGNLEMQLAAIAFNPMMEYYLYMHEQAQLQADGVR
jgi:hypothetical protein